MRHPPITPNRKAFAREREMPDSTRPCRGPGLREPLRDTNPRRRAVPRRARRVRAGRARRRCASRWRRASIRVAAGRTPAPCCRPGSCSSRPRTRARAAAGRRARASATTLARRATSAGCRARCSTASTCASPCSGRRSTSCSTRPAASRRAVVAARVAAARALALERAGAPQRRARTATLLDAFAPARRRRALRVLRVEMERDRLTGRGYHRVRRVARTIADLRAGPRRRRSTPSDVEVADVEVRAVAAHAAARRDAGAGGVMAVAADATGVRSPRSPAST